MNQMDRLENKKEEKSGRKGTRTPGPLVCDTSALTN